MIADCEAAQDRQQIVVGFDDVQASPGASIFYLVGCGIFWRHDANHDAWRELDHALQSSDAAVRCVAKLMLAI
jgi:hypothetical protein